MKVKKFLAFVCAFAVAFQVNFLHVKAEEHLPKKVINVVYDDSGSMIDNVDTWCQAKYSMEVFAAMLGDNDTMNVYVMSDYRSGTSAGPKLTLEGRSGAANNVKQVHDMITNASSTPFNSVRKAYSDLTESIADEKWLVILTDGEFEDGKFTNEQVDEYLEAKQDDIKVMFLGMGPDAAVITTKIEKNIYGEKAENNSEILEKITDICTQIFETNKLEVNKSNGKFSFDIPLSEIVVFAQGDNVKINGISDGSRDINPVSQPVGVKYSEVPSTRKFAHFIIDRNLNGSLATFKGDFSAGNYIAKVENADSIEVYYKPNVELRVFLTDEDGQEKPVVDAIKSGKYGVRVGFIRAGTQEPVPDSKLLGNVRYHAVLTAPDGTVSECKDGETIDVVEGEYHIDAKVEYLKYNTAETSVDFKAYRNKDLLIEAVSNPKFVFDENGLKNPDDEIVLNVTLEGKEISKEIWDLMADPVFTLKNGPDENIELTLEKSKEPGKLIIRSNLINKKSFSDLALYHDIQYTVEMNHVSEDSTWSGSFNGKYNAQDNRILPQIAKFIVMGLIGLFFLGYVPGIKKYLPKKLKALPSINCVSTGTLRRKWTSNGRISKSLLSTILPYKAEKCSVMYYPAGVSGGAIALFKAAGNNRMFLTNPQSFINNSNIKFDGKPLASNKKKYIFTGGLKIELSTTTANYSCICNKSNKK